MSKFSLLLLPLMLFALLLTAGNCPGPGGDDDDSGLDDDDSPGEASLCSGPGCMNSADCPADEPFDSDPCGFSGNCHYCEDGSDTAHGYTCNGSSFSSQGDYVCNP